jgi:hypothetical protein
MDNHSENQTYSIKLAELIKITGVATTPSEFAFLEIAWKFEG